MVVILCFSFHMSMNGAIPFTRSSNLVQEIHEVSKTALLENPNFVVRRVEIELNDYPGSGANNRHTPRPQLGRGCNDC
ncbi:transmembrane protein [Perilla frutescens var. hirtella]|uniref:Transmembrane protein n=1 Tax=Perilla frutescens var. hirtella TaxID=608512 RepID=A0AAD4P2K7_PERFH|nr:transmembrane protein [Perilla frutescens var. frutescens]KAH6801223.1 transmembrane protein [Perilla frutescens var. hirtella]KAH6824364.1 transmembrane protein [Perilla frutescens var. hirtella]